MRTRLRELGDEELQLSLNSSRRGELDSDPETAKEDEKIAAVIGEPKYPYVSNVPEEFRVSSNAISDMENFDLLNLSQPQDVAAFITKHKFVFEEVSPLNYES
jgi:hypothetical protein